MPGPKTNHKDTFLYVATCSERSRGSFLLSRYDQKQRLMKELVLHLEQKIAQIADVEYEIHLANLFRDYGEEIKERMPHQQQLPELPKRVIEVPAKAEKKA